MYRHILSAAKKEASASRPLSEATVLDLARSINADPGEVLQAADSLARAGLLHSEYHIHPDGTLKPEYYANREGDYALASPLDPGNGIILDEPFSSAILRLGINEGLITSHLKRPFKALGRELAKGLSPAVQESALAQLLLFDNVVIPHDKAFSEVFDWSQLKNVLGIRVHDAGLAMKHRIREESLRIWLAELPDLPEDELSAWDRVLLSYLARRRCRIDRQFIATHLKSLSWRYFSEILDFGTHEQKTLYIPEIVDHRLDEFLRHAGVFREGPSESQRQIYDYHRKVFWLAETFFHLRYLQRMASNPFLPGVVCSSLPAAQRASDVGLDLSSDRVYRVFVEEINTLPRPTTLHDVITLRNASGFRDFQHYFHEWHGALSTGDLTREQELRATIRNEIRSLRKLGPWKAISGLTAYIGLPAGVLGALVVHPAVFAGGLVLSIVGTVSQAWIDHKQRRHRWLLITTT